MIFRGVRWAVVAMGLILSFSFISGCSGGKKNDDKLVVWHWMTDRHETFVKLAERYEAEKGTRVEFVLNAPSDLYTTKIRAAAMTQTLPDIYGVLGFVKDLANFINSKLVHPLTPYYKENNGIWEKELFEKALKMTHFSKTNEWNVPEGFYGVPIDVMSIQLIYNKAIFKEAGITSIPKTWAEFLEVGKKVLEKTDKDFFVAGFGEPWIINSMVRNFAYNLMGEEKYLQTIKGEASYNSPEWVEVFAKFKDMVDQKLFAPGIVTMINKKSERLFAMEKVAVTLNGSWCVNVFDGMNDELDYGTMFYPSISENFKPVIMGGAGSSFVVNESSTKKEKAIDFLKWLTSKSVQAELSSSTNNLPSNKNSLTETKPILAEFADDMDSTIHPSLLPFAESPKVELKIARGIQSIIIGETSPDKLAKDVAEFKKKVMAENDKKK